MRTWVQIRLTVGRRCDHEFFTFILAPTAPTSLSLRRAVEVDCQIPECLFICGWSLVDRESMDSVDLFADESMNDDDFFGQLEQASETMVCLYKNLQAAGCVW